MSASQSSPRAQLIAELFARYDELALGAFREVRAEAKADGTAVTEVDRQASEMVLQALQAHAPDDALISEEEAQARNADAPRKWVVDPLDGTASFARGYPVWGLGIGLIESGQPKEGYLRFPALDETYVFDEGGFTFNGRPVAPLDPAVLRDTRNLLLDSSLHKRFRTFQVFQDYKLRIFGSNLYHMVSVAMGRAEAMLCGRVYLWDLAAALPITRARGFTERFVDGTPFSLEAVVTAENRRVTAPLIIAPPARIDELVAALAPLL